QFIILVKGCNELNYLSFSREEAKMRYMNALLVAIKNKYDISVVKSILEIFPSLVSIADHDGWFPIHIATLNRDVPVIDILISYGGDVQCCTPAKLTCLHFAAFHGDLATLEYLISKDVSVNAQNERGWT